MDESELASRDKRVIWHPATHFRDLEQLPPIPIARARGAFLEAYDGSQILDAISSWWTCLHGHGHPRIVEAVSSQLARLDHVMFAGFTHEPAIRLAEELLRRAPGAGAYSRVFYADCGSAAIEVALKMSFQLRQQAGEPERVGLASLANSYHGETIGALAVSRVEGYSERFKPLLFPVLELPVPNFERHDLGDLATDLGEDAPETLACVRLLEQNAEQLTAVLIEPLIQCAGRMVMPGAGFYRAILRAANRLGIHVIADEIAVGFGRTGRLFATDWNEGAERLVPDYLCLSKGLSGGVLPLSAVLVKRGLDEPFHGEPSRSFLHSHTFTANPVTCAAGLASLQLFDEERTLERVGELAIYMQKLRHQVARACAGLIVAERQAGLVAALEVLSPPDFQHPSLGPGRLSLALRMEALKRGVLLRPLNDTVYWMPPYCVSRADLDQLAETTHASIRAVLG